MFISLRTIYTASDSGARFSNSIQRTEMYAILPKLWLHWLLSPLVEYEVFFLVLESIKLFHKLNVIYDYFFSNYLGDSISEISIRHPVRIWHALENLDNDYPRTNNDIEGWHAVFRSTFSLLNISLRTLIKKLRDEEEAIMQRKLRIANGETIHRVTRYIFTAENLKKIWWKLRWIRWHSIYI